MKVLLINECHYPRGGADIVYLNTGRILASHGHEVHFFSIGSLKNAPCDDQKYFFRSSDNVFKRFIEVYYNKSAMRALEKMIRDVKPDVAHIHLLWGVLTPSVLKVLRDNEIPTIHTAHDYLMCCPVNHFLDKEGRICEKCKQRGFFECIKNRCYKGNLAKSIVLATEFRFRNLFFPPEKFLSGIIFVSQFSREKHFEHKESLRHIPNIVLYNCAKKEETTIDNAQYFLFFGRLSEEKGVDVLINAFKELPDFALKIVGGGPLRSKLEQLAGGASNIEFLGFKKKEELVSIIRDSRFVIIPSRCYENNPMTIVESYSLGRPVIGSRIGGIPEVIEEGKTGFTFEMGDYKDLRQIIQKTRLISKADYGIMSNNAIDYFNRNFTEDTYYNTLIEFYSSFNKYPNVK